MQSTRPPNPKLIFTDLDGTFLNSHRKISSTNLLALEAMGKAGIIRVACTGRSPELTRTVLTPSTPIDYLIFSTGVGAFHWPTQKLMFSHSFERKLAELVYRKLCEQQLNFMMHSEIPTQHTFHTVLGLAGSIDFETRRSRLKVFLTERQTPNFDAVSQFVIVVPASQRHLFSELQSHLLDASLILATSPLNSEFFWIEVLPKGVSKAGAAHQLVQMLAISQHETAALGNDYNDIDLLHWAGRGFVVSNAPKELHTLFSIVRSHDEDGFADFWDKIAAG